MEILFKDYKKMTRDEIVKNLIKHTSIKVLDGKEQYIITYLGKLTDDKNKSFRYLLEYPVTIDNLRKLDSIDNDKIFILSKKADYGKKLAENHIVIKVVKSDRIDSIDF